MRNLVYSISAGISVLLMLLLGGCQDVFEKDISGLTVKMVSPGDSTHSGTAQVSFYWEAIDENSSYRLQIVTPNFGSPSRFILDTLVSGIRFEYSLGQGTYQWRIRGENGSSYTAYTTRTFTVDSITDLSKQVLVLRYPINNAWVNDSNVTLQWDKIDLATSYSLIVRKGTEKGNVVYSSNTITDNKAVVKLSEGDYYWEVRGSNKLTSTQLSTSTFRLDLTDPSPSTPYFPARDTIVNFGPLTFSWKREANASYDSIMIYTLAGPPVSQTYYSSARYTDTTFRLDSLPLGNYTWKIWAIDAAGNKSTAISAEAKFVVR
ncbi:MAG: hypothetical protein V4616_08560 [Bacteroidota bacterium]